MIRKVKRRKEKKKRKEKKNKPFPNLISEDIDVSPPQQRNFPKLQETFPESATLTVK